MTVTAVLALVLKDTVVARYFLNIMSGDRIIEDPDGSDCEDLDCAREDAMLGLRESLADAIDAGNDPTATGISITDENGTELARVLLREVISARLKGILSH